MQTCGGDAAEESLSDLCRRPQGHVSRRRDAAHAVDVVESEIVCVAIRNIAADADRVNREQDDVVGGVVESNIADRFDAEIRCSD